MNFLSLIDKQMRKLIWRLAPFLYSFFFHFAQASKPEQGIISTESDGHTYLTGSNLFYLVDPLASSSIEEISQSTEFVPAGNRSLNFGYTSSVIWVRLITSNNDADRFWNIIIENPNLEKVEAYSVKEGKIENFFSATKSTKKYADYLLSLPRGTNTIYLRITANDPIYLPIKLIDTVSFVSHRRIADILHAAYFGVLLCFIFYNFFMFISLKDKAYLYYLLYTINIGLTFAYISGYFLQIGGPVVLNSFFVFNSLAAVFAMIFTIHFLEFPFRKQVNGIATGLSISFLLPLALALYGLERFANQLMQFICFVVGSFLLTLGFMSLFIAKYRPVRFFFLGWTVFIIGSLILILKDLGFLPFNVFTQNLAQVGSVLESILFSVALADRIAYYQSKKEKADKKEIQYVKEYNVLTERRNAVLQSVVRDRTKKLEEINHIKDNFFSIIASDLRGPLISLSKFTHFLNSRSSTLSVEEIIKISKERSAEVSDTITLTENLLQWAKLQAKINEFIKEKVSVNEAVHQSFEQLKNLADAKGVHLVNLVSTDLEVEVDRNQMMFVLNNLFSNTIRYSPYKSNMVINAKRNNDFIELTISDNGTGVSESILKNIFSIEKDKAESGTNDKSESGLGLVLCYELINKNGGMIEVQRVIGGGTNLIVSLPSAAAHWGKRKKTEDKIVL